MMKKLIILLSAAFIASCSSNEKKSDEAILEISLTNSNTENVYLVAYQDEEYDTIAFGQPVDNKLSLAYTLEYPQLVYLAFTDQPRPMQIFADTDGMQVDIDFTVSPPKSEVTGSEYQTKLESFYEMEDGLYKSMTALNGLRAQAEADQVIASMLKQKEDSIYKAFKNQTIAFCKESGIVGAMIANRRLYDITYAQADSVYQNIEMSHLKNPEVKALSERIDILKKVKLGEPFLNITQKDTADVELSLETTVKANKLTLIDFWASWCMPCRNANPALVETYKDFHDKGFEIYGVSLDKEGERWKEAIKVDGLMWPNVSQLNGFDNEAAKSYGVQAIPQSVLINEYGVIVVKNLNELDLRAYLEEHL